MSSDPITTETFYEPTLNPQNLLLLLKQGVNWVLKREEANGLRTTQQSHAKYIDTVS